MLSAVRLWWVDFTVSVRQANPDFRWKRHVWWAIAFGSFLATATVVVLGALVLVFGRPMAEHLGISAELSDSIAFLLGGVVFVNLLLAVSGRESREIMLPFDAEALDAAGYRMVDVLIARLWLPKIASCIGWMGLIVIIHLSLVPNSLSNSNLQTLLVGLLIVLAGHLLGGAIPLVQQRRLFNGRNVFLIVLCGFSGTAGWLASTLSQWLKGDILDWRTAVSNAFVTVTAPRSVLIAGVVAAMIVVTTCVWLAVKGRKLAAGPLVSYSQTNDSHKLTFPLTRFVKAFAERSPLNIIFLRPVIAAFRASSGDDAETPRVIRWSVVGITFGIGLHLGGTSALFDIFSAGMAPATLLLGIVTVPIMHAQTSLQAHRGMRSLMFDRLSPAKINFSLAGGALLTAFPPALALYTILTWLFPHVTAVTLLFFAAWLLSPLPGLVSDSLLKISSKQSALRIHQTISQTLVSGQVAVLLVAALTYVLDLTTSPTFVLFAAFTAMATILLLFKPRMRAL